MTAEKKEYLYCLKDYSEEHHTGQFLAEEIISILNKVGPKKFIAIVSDNGSNVKLARELVKNQFPHIINLRCIAHFINLITKSILG